MTDRAESGIRGAEPQRGNSATAPGADRVDFCNELPVCRADLLPLELEVDDFDLESTRFGSAEILDLELSGHAGLAFADVASEGEAPRLAGLRGRRSCLTTLR